MQLAPLLGELERRAHTHPEELSALLSECRAAYFGARKGLLVGRLTEEIKGLDPARTELVELVSRLIAVDLEFTWNCSDEDGLQLLKATMHRRVRFI